MATLQQIYSTYLVRTGRRVLVTIVLVAVLIGALLGSLGTLVALWWHARSESVQQHIQMTLVLGGVLLLAWLLQPLPGSQLP